MRMVSNWVGNDSMNYCFKSESKGKTVIDK